jgi:predicted RNase H-like nuclease
VSADGATVYTGFDSAWTAGHRGALASVAVGRGVPCFHPPVAVSFDEARALIEAHGAGASRHLIAIDQPLIVPNPVGSRPCEAAVRPAICRLRGAVQPANRGRSEMFGDDAPIWPFLASLDACIDPSAIARATGGRFAFEVYPALAAAGLFPELWSRRRLYKYNPSRRRTFTLADWRQLCGALARRSDEVGVTDADAWCRRQADVARPRKADQDALDAVFCVLIALLVARAPSDCLLVGDLERGYIVTPAVAALRDAVSRAAAGRGVPISTLG